MLVEPAQAPGEGLAAQLPAEIRDGYEVHQAALRRGLNVVLYPRQVLMVSTPDGTRELAFIHGIPPSSTLGPVTYAQDKRMRRSLLERADLPIPKGATFSMGKGINDAKNFVERIGYPVVVKPAMGDNAIETFTGVYDEQRFDEVLDYLRTPPPERPTYTRAAYALTELRQPGEEDGRVVVPPGYRFLVEQHVPGTYVRHVVIDDVVRSVVQLSAPPSAESVGVVRDVMSSVDATLCQLAVDAVRALPGLGVAAVDMVVNDYQRPAEEQDVWIVELSERPGLAVPARASEELSRELGDTILRVSAAQESLPLPDPQDEVAVDFHAEAVPDQDAAVAALARAADELRLTGHVGVTDRVEGIVDGVLQGPAEHLARLSELLLDGKLDGSRAMLVEERHRTWEELDGFTVRS